MRIRAIESFIAGRIAARNQNVGLQEAIAARETDLSYDRLVRSKGYIQRHIDKLSHDKKTDGKTKLDGWIICGSGIATLPESPEVEILERLSMQKVGFFSPRAQEHGQEIIIAKVNGQLVGIQTGRGHIYDTDYSPRQLRMITDPLVVAKGLGVDWIITTNAAGALNNGNVAVGDVAVDTDYANHHGVNPLIGPNDERLGNRFPSKKDVADPYIFSMLSKTIDQARLHLGAYNLADNAPLYEGGIDILRGKFSEFIVQNPEYVPLYGMSFALEAMIMQHFNNIPQDKNGFDRRIRWIGITAITNLIENPEVPTKAKLLQGTLQNPNPANHEMVLSGGEVAEKTLIPAIINLCDQITRNPLPNFGTRRQLNDAA